MASSQVNYAMAQPQQAMRVADSPLLYQNAPLYYYGGYRYTPLPPGPPATPATPAPTPQPASPTASASDLQILLASIRPAQDGEVITAEDHNALRNAMVAIANRLGLGPVSEETTVTVVPQFFSTTGSGVSAWTHEYGAVTRPSATAGSVKGWKEVELPEGARIKKMVAYATATLTGSGKLTLRLIRQKVTDTSVAPVLVEALVPTGADISKGVEADVTLPGTGAGVTAIEEFRKVNNREQKYLLTAEIDDVTLVTAARIVAVQIVCGR